MTWFIFPPVSCEYSPCPSDWMKLFTQVANQNVSRENTPVLISCVQLRLLSVSVSRRSTSSGSERKRRWNRLINMCLLFLNLWNGKKKMKLLTAGMRNMTSVMVKPAQRCFTCEGHWRLLFRWKVARCVGSDGIFITIICSSFLPAGCALRSFASHLTKWKSSWKWFVLLQLKLVHWVPLAVLCALCSTFLPDAYQVGALVPMT